MRRIGESLGRRPRLSLAVMALATAFVAAGVVRLRFDSSLESLAVPGDPVQEFQRRTERIFGSEEIGVVALVAPDVFRPEVLEALRRVTGRVGAIDGVRRALSVANAPDLAADVLGMTPLMTRGRVDQATARHLQERVRANPLYVPNLAGRDGRALAINVFFDSGLSAGDEERIDRAIEAIVSGYDGPGDLYYTGMSHLRVRAVRMMRADLLRFLPLSLLGMMVVLWCAFRSVRALVLPLATIGAGVLALLGLMGWLGEPITLSTLVLPSLLLVIGGSYSIHVTAAALGGEDPSLAAILDRVGLPVVISALTTAVGFGSLAFHSIPAISRLGVFAVVGIALVAAGSLLGLGLAFQVLPRRRMRRPRAGSGGRGYIDEWATRLAAAGVDRRRAVFAMALVAGALAVTGAARIRIDTDILEAFRPASDIRRAHEAISRTLAGPNPLVIVVTAPEPGYFKSLVALRRVKDLQEFIEELDGVDTTISLIDYLEELDLGLQAGGDVVLDERGRPVEPPPPFWQTPPGKVPVVFNTITAARGTFSGLIDEEMRRLRITARTSVSGSRETAKLAGDIRAYAEAMFPKGVEVTPTGNLVVVSSIADRLLSGQIESLAVAFGVIFAVLAVLFLSFRVGLAAMIPNMLPVLVFFGVMGWAGIDLNLVTSIIGAVALGIAVDDTIHYMARLNRIVKNAGDQRSALIDTMAVVGRPVVATSFTLTAGFLVMVVSGFWIISAFGWLSAMTMLVALATNLVLLPAVLATVPVISVWDLVAFRLGERPHRTIPLFDGLGPVGVRMVVLLGRVRTFAAGERIVRTGDPGSEMYLVLGGRAEVRAPEDGRVIATARRGDVFGEMALLRHTRRIADVVACEDVEVLVIDEEFLRRLRVRYPRLAAKFFLNIARILSDRLEKQG